MLAYPGPNRPPRSSSTRLNNADAIGLVFYPPSPRFVTPEQAARSLLDWGASAIGGTENTFEAGMSAAGDDKAAGARIFAIRVAPVSVVTARAMIDEVKGLATIRGYRGLPRGDTEALARAIVALSQLARIETVREAEINPLIVKADGVVAVDGLEGGVGHASLVFLVLGAPAQQGGLEQLVGRAPAFLRVIARLPSVARSNRPVLIAGETGIVMNNRVGRGPGQGQTPSAVATRTTTTPSAVRGLIRVSR